MGNRKSLEVLETEREEAELKRTGNFPMPTDRDALLYGRYSSARQVRASISKGLQQADDLIQRALNEGWTREHMHLFIENNMTKDGRIRSVSGTISIDDRAGLSTVMEHVKTGKAGALFCDDISRLTRDADLVDATTLARLCKKHNVEIITNERRFNFKRQGDYDAYIKEAQQAAAYLELHIKGKMLRNRTRKAEQGKVANGVAPIGLKLDATGNNFIPSVHRNGVARLYQRIVELGMSRNALLRELNALAQSGKPLFPVHPDIDPKTIHLNRVCKVHCTNCKLDQEDCEHVGWTVNSRAGLTNILTNVAYLGHLAFNGVIVKRNAHEAIVETDLWHVCNDCFGTLDVEGRPIDKPAKTVRYNYPESQQTALLSGVRPDGRPVIDGVNGLHVYVKLPENFYVLQSSRGNTGTGGYETSIKVHELDALIENELMGMLQVSELAASHPELHDHPVADWQRNMVDFDQARQAQSTQTTTPQEDTLETLEAQIALVEQDLQFSSGVMDIQTRTELYAKKARLYQRRDKLTQAEAYKTRTQERLEKARSRVKTAKDRWHSWDLDEKRSFIHVATDSIILEEIASGWLHVAVQWTDVLDGSLYDFYLWRDSGTLWSKEEEALLRQYYSTAKRTDLLNMLSTRSWRSINGMAWRLKLRRKAPSDSLPIPDTMSTSDVQMLLWLSNELDEDEIIGEDEERLYIQTSAGTIEVDNKRLFVHITQPPNHDTRSRPRDCLVESPRYG